MKDNRKLKYAISFLACAVVAFLVVFGVKTLATKSSASEKSENEDATDASELKNIWYTNPPNYVRVGGVLQQIRSDAEGDYSEYRVGTISALVDRVEWIPIPDDIPVEEGCDRVMPRAILPSEEGETNFEPYLGCDYAYCDGTWYLYYNRKWRQLGADSAVSKLPLCCKIDGQLYMTGPYLPADTDYSDYRVGKITSYVDRVKDIPPSEDGQTNYAPYLDCEYACVDGKLYLFCTENEGGGWMELKPFDYEQFQTSLNLLSELNDQ